MAIPFYKAFERLLQRTVSGKDFNQVAQKEGRKFYKLTNKTENHNGLQYQTGLNVDIKKFEAKYNTPGLHFTDERLVATWEKILIKTGYPMYFKRQVLIPDDAKVYYDYYEVKSDKVILCEPEKLWLVYESRFPLYQKISGKEFNNLSIISQKQNLPVRLTFSMVRQKASDFREGLHVATNLYWQFVEDSQIGEYQKKMLNVLCDPPYFWNRRFFVRPVLIPDDAIVICEYEHFRTDKIIFGAEKEL